MNSLKASIQRLKNILPPPLPLLPQTDSTITSQIERLLGIRFPPAYHELIQSYGAGRIDDFIWLMSPNSCDDHLRIQVRGVDECVATKSFLEKFSIKPPLPLYPEVNGIFPWAFTENGDLLFFTPERTSNAVLIFPRQSNAWEHFNLNVIEFLTAVLVGAIKVTCFPRDFPQIVHQFLPAVSIGP